jgi:protein-S-isoprenylcysteine O-methyltransferase Ste14
MGVPRNVLWFEVLLYISLMLDALSVAVSDRTPTFEITEDMITAQTILNGVVILLLFYFVYLSAQRRKNWPRWVLLAALVLSSMSLVQVIGQKGMTLDAGFEVISCALTMMGLYYSFTGDARGWFNA